MTLSNIGGILRTGRACPGRIAAGLLLLTAATAAMAPAYPLMLDYTGFTWNSLMGGQERLESVGVLDGFTPEVQAAGETYTYYISGLLLASDLDLGGGYHLRELFGGAVPHLSVHIRGEPALLVRNESVWGSRASELRRRAPLAGWRIQRFQPDSRCDLRSRLLLR